MESSKNKLALFVTANKRHYTAMRPVIQAAKKRGWTTLIFRFETLPFMSLLDKFASKISSGKRHSLKSFYQKREINPRKHFFMLYVKVAKIVWLCMHACGLNPDVTVVESDRVLACKIAVLAAKHGGRSSLLLLHQGVLGYNYSVSSFLTDKIAVISPFAKEILMENKVDENRITVTGRPVYDVLLRRRFRRNDIFQKFGLNPDKKTVVYTTENIPIAKTKHRMTLICLAIKELIHYYQRRKEWNKIPQLFVKVHPEEKNLRPYIDAITQARVTTHITRKGGMTDLYQLLSICDVLVTGFSTTALDAMLFGIPIVTLNFTGIRSPVPYAESGASLNVVEKEDLAWVLRHALYDIEAKKDMRRAQKQFVFQHAYKQDGLASERTVKLMESVIV